MRDLQLFKVRSNDLAYLAGIVDGEGCISVVKSKPNRRKPGNSPRFYGQVAVAMTDRAPVDLLFEVFGCGNRCIRPREMHRTQYVWKVIQRQAVNVCEELLPYLRVKYPQALLVVRLGALTAQSLLHRTVEVPAKGKGRGQQTHWRLSNGYLEKCERFVQASRYFNQRGEGLPVPEDLDTLLRRALPCGG